MIKKRQFISLLLSLVMVFSAAIGVWANEGTTNDNGLTIVLEINNSIMAVNGEETAIDENGTTPVLQSGRTLLPVRAVVEAMGGTVEWDSSTETAQLKLGDDEIQLSIGKSTAIFNDSEYALDVEPVLLNGRTMLPIRFIAERFGYSVDWDNSSIVTLTQNSPDTINDTEDAAIVENNAVSEIEENTAPNILIVYFSKTGNTLGMAQEIQKYVGGDMVEIEPLEAYPENHEETVEIARAELDENFRPPLKTTIDNMEEYDIVFLGYPIWWSTVPMAVATFLESYDFSGKTIIPFSTHGGSRFGSSISDIRELSGGAAMLEGLTISRDNLESIETEVPEWLRSLELID